MTTTTAEMTMGTMGGGGVWRGNKAIFQLDKRCERGVMRGDGAMRSRGAIQMGGGNVRRGYATTSQGTRGTRGA